jgi:hypothetical protein
MFFVVPKSPWGSAGTAGRNENAEAIIEEVVRREYDKLR